jgi:hypothetical protein
MSNVGAEADSAAARARAPESRSWRVVPGVFGLAGASVAAPAGGISVDRGRRRPCVGAADHAQRGQSPRQTQRARPSRLHRRHAPGCSHIRRQIIEREDVGRVLPAKTRCFACQDAFGPPKGSSARYRVRVAAEGVSGPRGRSGASFELGGHPSISKRWATADNSGKNDRSWGVTSG